ncbi:hypothetical protein PRIPAC_98042 [Pristionchus pacificus]|uniref:Uncharacterized protein n=1 Tax=Pristionchus pacificus TaxID=54126 RepID=A0A2A6BJE1_PRIPA|nr:hypothetical protein PRIPAC_98042 [Pristionchus pacificus]|eukprot:PDM66034.1 hypothetical protein PRIPAC_44128 [Pristionchus pacificus]
MYFLRSSYTSIGLVNNGSESLSSNIEATQSIIDGNCKGIFVRQRSFPVVYALFFLAISKPRDYLCGRKTDAEAEKMHRGMENVSVDAHVTRLEDAWNAKLDSKVARRT